MQSEISVNFRHNSDISGTGSESFVDFRQWVLTCPGLLARAASGLPRRRLLLRLGTAHVCLSVDVATFCSFLGAVLPPEEVSCKRASRSAELLANGVREVIIDLLMLVR